MALRTLLPLSLIAVTAGLLAATTAPAWGQASSAQVVANASEISFTTRQMGVPVDGKFSKFTAQITLDSKKPEAGNVAFNIDTSSARFGSAELDAEVPKATWLNALKFPHASFQSSAIKSAGPGKYEVLGKLSIKGQTRDISVPVQLVQTASGAVASGGFVLKRLDFKVGENEWADTSLLANDVQVKFKLTLTGMAAF